MSPEELDAHLLSERTCTMATVGPHGPHVTALWFAWDGTSLWLSSVTRSQRWADLQRNPRVAVLVEAGVEYAELRGAELTGRVEMVGEIPRTGADDDALRKPERLFAAKYSGGDSPMVYDGRHAWLRLTPTKIVSWDFRKLDL